MYVYEQDNCVCMCCTVTKNKTKQKTQNLFDEFLYSFNILLILVFF